MKNLLKQFLNKSLFSAARKSTMIKEAVEEVSRRLTIEKLDSLIKNDKVPVCQK